MDLAEHCGWWWPFTNACIITPKPSLLKMENGKLHCTTGPALAYGEAWKLYFIEGNPVPRWMIEGPQNDDEFKLREEHFTKTLAKGVSL